MNNKKPPAMNNSAAKNGRVCEWEAWVPLLPDSLCIVVLQRAFLPATPYLMATS